MTFKKTYMLVLFEIVYKRATLIDNPFGFLVHGLHMQFVVLPTLSKSLSRSLAEVVQFKQLFFLLIVIKTNLLLAATVDQDHKCLSEDCA